MKLLEYTLWLKLVSSTVKQRDLIANIAVGVNSRRLLENIYRKVKGKPPHGTEVEVPGRVDKIADFFFC